MKVFNLACEHGHLFEGWFASHEAFEEQQNKGLVVCPFCESNVISRQLSAPRLNLSGATHKSSAIVESSGVHPGNEQAFNASAAQMLEMMRSFIAKTEDVGKQFAEEARKIHYGEAPERSIRGQATDQEREALREDGIETYALPIPSFLKEPMQ